MKAGGVQRAAELAYIALILFVAVVLWREAGKLPPAPYDPLGPAAFPRAAAVGLGGLGLALAVRFVLGANLGRSAQSLVTGLDDETEHVRRPWTAALTLVLSFAYAAVLSQRWLPFLFATGLYLFAAGVLLGPLERRRIIGIGVFAVTAAVVLDLLFRRVFSLDLP